MRIYPTVATVLVGIVLVTLVASGGAGAAEHEQPLESCAAESPSNFSAPTEGDAIGYVGGYWYDEPIVIEANGSGGGGSGGDAGDGSQSRELDASDGLDEAEAAAVVARTAARVETLRCLSFASVPTIEIANRSEVRADQQAMLANRSAATRRFDDARLAATLLLGTKTNATQARAATTAGATRGFYDAETDEIVLVGDENGTYVDEPTLAHELVHALQDQQFDLSRFDAALTDVALAESGLIEGDASLVEHRYERRCSNPGWATSCLDYDVESTENGEFLALELFFFQPYNNGGRYVETLYDAGGWAAVDARYDDPPVSSKQIMVPSTPESFEPATVTFATEVDANWTLVEPDGRPAHDVMGPGTIGAAMIAPTFDSTDGGEIYSANHVTNNVGENELDPLRPYVYSVDAATGWQGGRLEVYTDSDDTAVRWRTTWKSEQSAATFYQRYVQLLEVRGGDRSNEFAGTYSFPPESTYDGRVSIRRSGSSVTVVHAPTLEAVRSLDANAAQQPPELPASNGDDGTADRVTDELSGLGALAVIGSILVLGLVAFEVARRR
ncbi:Hvo_1808 family surface protein [Salinarchaeum chitinilyticum]